MLNNIMFSKKINETMCDHSNKYLTNDEKSYINKIEYSNSPKTNNKKNSKKIKEAILILKNCKNEN